MQERGGIRTTGLSIDGRPIMTEVDDLKKIREENGYYVDKSALIDELLRKKKEVNLFTRPRRFGKSLNLSMLDAYFNERYAGNPWFDDLCISIGNEQTRFSLR